MAKRFTDTEKWIKNKWFRTLTNEQKLFWLFILDNCDNVGVWEEDIEFVSTHLNIKLTKEELLSVFAKQIQVINDGKKWWIINFCGYQYGELKEDNIKNKPHQRYIQDLKKHRLWIDYKKTINSLEEKDKDKEEEKEKDNKGASEKFAPPTVEEVVTYFREKGYSDTAAKKAHEYYRVYDWKDGKGDKVKNWKQKMIAVWFKPENAIQQSLIPDGKFTKTL